MRRFARYLLLAGALALLAACQPNLKKPLVEIRGLQPTALQQGRFLLRLQLENPVRRGYRIEGIEAVIRLDPQLHLRGETQTPLEIGKNATELVELEVQRTQLSKILWTAFINRPGDAMPYTAEITVRVQGGKVWRQEIKGQLYKVPGKPWHLRG